MDAQESQQVLRVEVLLAGESLCGDKADDTVFDIVAYPDTTLQSIGDVIAATADPARRAEQIRYYSFSADSDRVQLDAARTLEQLGIQNGGRIVADVGNKRKRFQRPEDSNEDDQSGSGELLSLYCTTRFFAAEGIPLREVHVLVRKRQRCRFLMEDVAALWKKTNLKFRCGRILLAENRTYEELGINEDAKIVVTGGRA